MRMNSFAGKRLLAMIRESDCAHAGEEEAIEMTLRKCPQRRDHRLLDVGCGRGGTANYVQEHGWGVVTGIDVETASIARAQHVYPDVEFHACNVMDAASKLDEKFDLIYLFNSFYAFADQPRALAVLAELAENSGRLAIFDYTDRGGYADYPLLCNGEPFIPHPIDLSTIEGDLRQAGWNLLEVEDITKAYERWYDELLRRIEQKRDALIEVSGPETFAFVRNQYAGLLCAIRTGGLGGAIIHAKRA